MGLIRPATPGFLVTLTATILLAVVSFSVPYFKSIFFLKASLSVENIEGSVTFGTLGYCLTLPNGMSCTKPSIGYEFDINALVGDKIKIAQIPAIAVKWITYVLFLHVVALVLAAVSAAFGLLAHVREMAMTCCSSCISGFAATAAFFAFVFDLVFFFLARSRLNAVKGGSAQIGLAIWLTLAAWVLLFFSGCFYAIGRCCVSRRPSNTRGGADKWAGGGGASAQDDAMRLQAVKAEADRKALAQRQEGGLPSFHEYEHGKAAEAQPLTARVEGDEVYVDEPGALQYQGGYAPAPPGTRTVDTYADARRQPSAASAQTTYPPQPQPQAQPARQASGHAQATSGYALSNYGAGAAAAGAAAGAAAAQYGRSQVGSPGSQYLAPTSQYGGAPNSQYGGYQQPQPGGAVYGHGQDKTSYHSASSHVQQPSSYSVYDPYAPQQQQPQSQGYYGAGQPASAYTQTAPMMTSPPIGAPYAQASAYSQPQQAAYSQPQPSAYVQPQYSGGYNQQPGAYPAHDRSYTLGGGGYGAPALSSPHDARPSTASPGPGYMPHPADYQRSLTSPPMPSPTHISTAGAYQAAPPLVSSPTELEPPMGSPPRYDGPLDGPPPPGNYGWDAKR